MSERKCCTKCGKPIMIKSSKPESKVKTTLVVQVTKFACLNKDCIKYDEVVDRTEQPYD